MKNMYGGTHTMFGCTTALWIIWFYCLAGHASCIQPFI